MTNIPGSKLAERFFKTDVNYLARGSFWLMLGNSLNAIVAIVLSIAYAHYLGKEIYGSYRYVLSIVGMLSALALPGLSVAISRSVARGFEGTWYKGWRYIFASSILISLGLFIAATIAWRGGDTRVMWGLLTAGTLVPIVEGFGAWRGYLEGKREFKQKTIVNIAIKALYGISMATVVIWSSFNGLPTTTILVLLVGTYFITLGIPNLIVTWYITKHKIPRNAPLEKGAIRYGIHLSAADILPNIANYIDGLLLFHFLGPAALAIYSFALAPIEQIKATLNTARLVGFPKIAEKTTNQNSLLELKKVLPKKVFRASLIMIFVVAIYIVVAPYLYEYLFPQYGDSVNLSRIFALSLLPLPFGLFSTALGAEGNIRKIYAHKSITPILQIMSLLILVPFFGLWGAITGRILGRMLSYIIPTYLFIRS